MKFCQLSRIQNRVRSGLADLRTSLTAAEKFVSALKNRLANTTKHFYLNRLNVCWRANWQRNFGAQNSIWQPNGSGIWRPGSVCKTRIDSPGRIGIVPPSFYEQSPGIQGQINHLSIDFIARCVYITGVRFSTRVSAAITKTDVLLLRGFNQTAVQPLPYFDGVSRLRRKCL